MTSKASQDGSGISFLRSIRGKMIIIFLALSLLPLALISFLALQQAQRGAEMQIKETTVKSVQLQEGGISQWLAERMDDMVTLAGINSVQSMDPAQAGKALRQYYDQWAIYDDMFLCGLDGYTITTIGGAENVYLGDREYFKRALEGKTTLADPLRSRVDNKVIIVLAAPITVNGKVVGVIGGTVATTYIDTLLRGMWIGETGDSYLINSAGYFISESRFSEDLKQAGIIQESAILEIQVDNEGSQRALAGETGSADWRNYRDVPVVGAFTPVEGTSWALLFEQDSKEVYQSVSRIQFIILVSMLVIALIVLVLAILFSKNLSDPLVVMAGALENLRLGDLNRQLPIEVKKRIIERTDEYGLVGSGLKATEEYLIEMSGVANQIAAGDLTAEITPRSERDEIGIAFNQMIVNLRTAIGEVAENAGKVNLASQQLADAAGQAGQATTQISTTIQQVARGIGQQSESVTRTAASAEQMARAIDGVAKGAQEQATAISKASGITNQINTGIQQVAGNAQAVTRDSAVAADAAHQGGETVQETIHGMENIRAKVGISAEKMREMGARSDQIGVIIETIEDIASQTNLLALNAAIEAARAGEHGKGFAVVADEVRKLAERAAGATKEIGELIKGIQSTVGEAVTAMEEGAKEVEVGVESANRAGEALASILQASESVNQRAAQSAEAAEQMSKFTNELVNSVDAVSSVVEENTAATEEMAANSSEVTQAIENIASVSEENSAAVEEVSASTEEMSAQVEEVTASAQSLAEMAQALQKVVDQFKLLML